MTISIVQLAEEWAQHPAGSRRATGGQWSLHGFGFQLGDSLLRLVRAMKKGDGSAAGVALEGLSDLSVVEDEVLYLIQHKATLTSETAKSVAREALAIDRFLADAHPELRERVAFTVRTRTVAPGTSDPRAVSAQALGLTGDDVERWKQVRTRMRAPEEAASPRPQLIAELFPLVDDPIGKTDELVGRAVTLIGAGTPSDVLTEALQAVISAGRATPPPGAILVPQDFHAPPVPKRLLLGQRPEPRHLGQGFAMPRDERVEQAIGGIRAGFAAADGDGAGGDETRIPIHLVVGASGVGKSIVLLQALRRLAEDEELTVHRIPHLPTSLRAALAHWKRGRRGRVVLAMDEVYGPARRDTRVWEEIVALALEADWAGRLVVAGTGSPADRKALRELADRDGAFVVSATELGPLSAEERRAYSRWVAERTTLTTLDLDEPLIAVAALRAQAQAGGANDGSVAQFAQRFIAQMDADGVSAGVRAALAVNRLGLTAAPALFAGRPAVFARLVRDNVLQADDEDPAVASEVTVFHQEVSRQVYAPLVEGADADEVSGHLSAAFAAMPPGDARRGALMTGLQENDLAEPLPAEVVVATLRGVHASVWADGRPAFEEIVPWVHAVARHDRATLQRPEVHEDLIDWMFAGPQAARALRALWWRFRQALPDLAAYLDARAVRWLREHPDDPGWSPFCATVLVHHDTPDTVTDLASGWLAAHPAGARWVELLVQTESLRAQPRAVPRAVLLAGLERAPVARSDEALWTLAEQAGVPRRTLMAHVLRRICDAPGKRTIADGARFVARTGRAGDQAVVWKTLLEEHGSPTTATALRTLRSAEGLDPALARTVGAATAAWLKRRPDSPEWPGTWLAAIPRERVGALEPELRQVTLRWVAENTGRRGWVPVVQRLLWADPTVDLPQVDAWLAERPDHPRWLAVWELRRPALPDDGAAVAAGWAALRTDHPRWPEVLLVAWAATPGDPELRRAAHHWLGRYVRAAAWRDVFEAVAADGVDEELRAAAKRWLGKHRRSPLRQEIERALERAAP